jgi:hypothetical protein
MPIHVNWTGQSGQTYTFEIAPIGSAFYAVPGVYNFCRYQHGLYYSIYVGETDDLNQRLNTGLQQHHAWPRIRLNGATHVGTLRVTGGLAARLNIETDLRHGCRPPCNLQ